MVSEGSSSFYTSTPSSFLIPPRQSGPRCAHLLPQLPSGSASPREAVTSPRPQESTTHLLRTGLMSQVPGIDICHLDD